MDIAERILKKHGWTPGQGLGKDKSGISKPIRAVKNQDNIGVGKKSSEWDHQWWDHIFNKTSISIQVPIPTERETENKPKKKIDKSMETKQERRIRRAAKKARKLAKKTVMSNAGEPIPVSKYGNMFVKATKIEKTDYSIPISDKDLLEACESRTCRKGARGEQNGKLSRLKD